MHSEDLFVNDRSNGQAVEAIRKGLPKLDVVSSFALVVETIDTIDGCAFVVSTENEEILWIFDLVCEEQADGLERLFPSIHIVS